MTDFPKISIITINLNNKEGLEKTILSVVSQVYKDFEYLVIDGESTDGSIDVIKNYSQKIDYWKSEKDAGIYNAMNKGISIAKGDYLLFLNSGDVLFDENVLKNTFEKYQSNEDLLYGKVKLEDRILDYPEKIDFAFFLHHTVCHQSVLIKRDLFQKFGMYDENFKIISDRLFFLKIFYQSNITSKYLPFIISIYDQSGISATNTRLLQLESKQVIDTIIPVEIQKIIEQNNYNKFILSTFPFNFFHSIRNLLKKIWNKVNQKS